MNLDELTKIAEAALEAEKLDVFEVRIEQPRALIDFDRAFSPPIVLKLLAVARAAEAYRPFAQDDERTEAADALDVLDAALRAVAEAACSLRR